MAAPPQSLSPRARGPISQLTQTKLELTVLATILAGAVAPLGWAPTAWWPVALASYAVLYLLMAMSVSATRATAIGALYGLAMHGVGSSWIYPALTRDAGLSVPMAAFGTAAFVAYAALFTAIPCLAWSLIARGQRGWSSVAAWAGLLTLGELARAFPFNGFTSLSLGYALIDTWLGGLAPLFGVYGLSFAGYAVAGAAANALRTRARAQLLTSGGVIALVFGTAAFAGAAMWVAPHGGPITVRAVQVNVAMAQKFDPLRARTQLLDYSRRILAEPADLIVTPETAFPMFLDEVPIDVLAPLQTFAGKTRSTVLVGVGSRSAQGGGNNSVIALSANDGGLQRYDRVSLMPFGEYAPAGFGWFTRGLHISLRDLTPGARLQRPFSVERQSVGVVTCSEAFSGERARGWVAQSPSATILVSPSNLAWFKNTLAISQSGQMVRMRALETGRPLVYVTNAGGSALIDHRGHVQEKLEEGTAGELRGSVQGMEGRTPYVRWADWPLLMLCGLGLLSVLSSTLSGRWRRQRTA